MSHVRWKLHFSTLWSHPEVTVCKSKLFSFGQVPIIKYSWGKTEVLLHPQQTVLETLLLWKGNIWTREDKNLHIISSLSFCLLDGNSSLKSLSLSIFKVLWWNVLLWEYGYNMTVLLCHKHLISLTKFKWKQTEHMKTETTEIKRTSNITWDREMEGYRYWNSLWK